MTSTLIRPNPSITEITGKPGSVWGSLPIPMSGKIIVKITGDTLQATLSNGLAQTVTRLRTQNLDTVEIMEAPNYFFLSLGGLLALIGILGCLSAMAGDSNFGIK
jgi:hypothetical protein